MDHNQLPTSLHQRFNHWLQWGENSRATKERQIWRQVDPQARPDHNLAKNAPKRRCYQQLPALRSRKTGINEIRKTNYNLFVICHTYLRSYYDIKKTFNIGKTSLCFRFWHLQTFNWLLLGILRDPSNLLHFISHAAPDSHREISAMHIYNVI